MSNHIPPGYQYTDCRGILRHAWHEVPTDWIPMAGTPITLRCERCGMERRDTLGTNTGDLITRRYVQPVGYKIEGDDKPKPVDFRLAWIEASINKQREARRERAAGATR